MTSERQPLPFDPIQEAARLWDQRWDETPRMRAVTSLMRVHQLVLTELDELLRPLGLTFARYEVLVLLSFSRRGALPLGKIGERLQVHATSVTPLVKRLESAGLIQRTPHPEDGRAVLASITPRGSAGAAAGDRGDRERAVRPLGDVRRPVRRADHAADAAAVRRGRLLSHPWCGCWPSPTPTPT